VVTADLPWAFPQPGGTQELTRSLWSDVDPTWHPDVVS